IRPLRRLGPPDKRGHQRLADPARLRGGGGAVRVRDRLLLHPGHGRARARAVGAKAKRRSPLRAPSKPRRVFRSIAPRPSPRSCLPPGGRWIHRALALLLALPCLLALAACGSKQDALSAPATKPFSVMLDWFPNADHAPLYTAIAHGDFATVGLDVRPVVPTESAEPLKLLAAGKVDAAISYEPELLLARDQGLRVVSIAALVQRPLTSIIALPGRHVRSVADLAGKRVGTAGIAYQAAELQAALQAAHAPPTAAHEVNVGFNLVPAMLSGQVDATLGGFWNYEGIQLRLMHKHPLVIPVDRAGVPTYDELVVAVRQEQAHR